MIYTIKAGTHDSTLLPGFATSHTAQFKVKFFENCRYTTVNPANQLDINKLFGFTEGLRHVHSNSARFGWAYNTTTQMMDLFSYCYVNSVRISKKVGEVAIGSFIDLKIIREYSNYKFLINGVIVDTVSKKNGKPWLSIKCYPYFGGDETAPHTMNIEFI